MPARDLIAMTLALSALVAAGCGGDEEAAPAEEIQVTVPEETERDRDPAESTTPIVEEPVEPVEPTPPPAPAPEPEPPPAPPAGGGGGTPAYDPSKEDSPRNDRPPPSGSPAERFEEYCDQNPEACG